MTEASKPMQVGLFWTRGEGWLSRVIMKVTEGDYSHMGICFRMEDMQEVYYEATARAGVSGPHDLEMLAQASGSKRTLVIWFGHLSPYAVEVMYAEAVRMMETASYGKLQLIFQWYAERIGKRTGWRMHNTPNRVTCSEYAARCTRHFLELRDETRDYFDAVTPASALVRVHEIQSYIDEGRGQL